MNRTRWPALLGCLFTFGAGTACAQAAADAAAPKPAFSIFGAANVQFERVSTSGSADPGVDKPARNRVSNVSSDLGFRASVPLHNGMTAQFQYVTGINLDNAAAGLFGSAKDAFVGIQFDKVGTLKLGRLSGAARWISGTADFSPAGAGPQDDQAMLTLASAQTGAAPQFNARLDNTLGFESVRWNGLSVRAYYSANEGRSNARVASGAPLNDSSVSLGLQYVLGDFDVRLSYEVRNDKGVLNNSTTNDTRDKDYRLGIRYTLMPGTQVALGIDHMSFLDNTATGTAKTSLSRRGWVVGARHQTGSHVVYGGLGQAGDVTCALANGAACNGNDTGARQVVLAYNYVSSKSLLWEVFFSRLNNDSRARYDFDAGGLSPAVGARLNAVGAGIRYTF